MVQQLEQAIKDGKLVQPKVSKAPIEWHVLHCLLIINGIILQLSTSNPKEYKWTFNITKILIMNWGKIPRGKAKAPKTVLPPEIITEEMLHAAVKQAKDSLFAFESLPNASFFKHPFFGHIKKGSTLKFLRIHTKHHLLIIDDIKSAHTA